MSDLDLLRRLGDQLVPPPLDALRETARRRDRRKARVAVMASAAAVVLVVVSTALLAGPDGGAPRHRPLGPQGFRRRHGR